MTLANLLRTGQLKNHEPDAAEIQRLLQAARRNIVDSRVSAISAETRFDDDGSVTHCIAEAEQLMQDVDQWLEQNRSDLT